MQEITKIDDNYKEWIKELSQRFKRSQIKAAISVNTELLRFYWSIGEDIVLRQAESKWGEKFFDTLSKDLQKEIPDAKGLSPINLRYMKRFYLLYNQNYKIVPQLVEDLFSIPWGHHRLIIDKVKGNIQKAIFFVQKAIENNWSRSVLLNFLDTNLYERQGKAITNFKTTLPIPEGELAQQLTKDPYNFDFLTLTEGFKEKELKDALMNNLSNFLLEMGRGFAYVGREYRLQVGSKEFFIDLLFYNIHLHAYCVVELKTTEFEPEYIGQLGMYMVAVNHQLKREGDNNTIGLIICKTKDNITAQYSLETTNQPIGISEFSLENILPEDFKSSLPSIEEIENELR
ncbi:MAG: DUF1016 family protein [Bacteroidales bacterium]|nr:DUF1016 family protein [Bacteroidales bacterium]